MIKLKYRLKKLFPLTLRDFFTMALVLIFASLLCFMLQTISDADSHVPLIFLLAVLVVSLLTNGYAFGLLSSVISIFAVNYAFTYPYFQFNFSMTGYPLTFLCSFAVSIITCTLTSRVRESEKIRLEGEREKMRANLLRAISHDFRTPLTSIIGSINVIIEAPDTLSDSEKIALLQAAKSDAEWLMNMVENLLSITRIGSVSGASLHEEPQVAEEIISEAVVKFHRQYPDMPVEVHIPDELLLIPMDAMLIEQVIINLLVNSVIHGGNVTSISIHVFRKDKMVIFRVCDDGVGISSEVLPQLFGDGMIQKSPGSAEDSTRNMGIGLSVCNAIVKAHKGYMKAENLPKRGAAVSFALPAGDELASQIDTGTDNTLMEDDFYGDKTENTDS